VGTGNPKARGKELQLKKSSMQVAWAIEVSRCWDDFLMGVGFKITEEITGSGLW
jgi:hypothetical protein